MPLSPTFPDIASLAEQRGKINYRMPTEWTLHLAEHGAVEGPGGWTWKWDPVFQQGMPSGYSPESATADFGNVQCPVLVFTGAEKDKWGDMPEATANERVAMFANATHHRVTGGGHYLHLERPDFTFEQIVAFLADLPSATDPGEPAS